MSVLVPENLIVYKSETDMSVSWNYYLCGYVVTPIIEACRQHGLFSKLNKKEFRQREWLIEELDVNGGYFTIALQVLEMLGWLEKNNNDAYRLTQQADAEYLDMDLTSLYAIEPQQLIHKKSFACLYAEKIEDYLQSSQTQSKFSRRLAEGSFVLPLILAIKSLGDDCFIDNIQKLDPRLIQAIEKLFTHNQWMTVDKTGLTKTGKELIQLTMFDMAISYRPVLYVIKDILFGNLSKISDDILADINLESLYSESELYQIFEQIGIPIEKQILRINDLVEQAISNSTQQIYNHALSTLATEQQTYYLDRYGKLQNSLAVLSYWQQQLIIQAENNLQLSILATHSLSNDKAQQTQDRLETVYFNLLNGLSHRHPISAEAFIILAATVGLFNDEQVKRYPIHSSLCRITVHKLCKRDYVIRHAVENDLERLYELEKICWQHTRTSKKQIRSRLQKYPQGQFVLEKSGKVLGVIYSQRIKAVESLDGCTAANVHQLHQNSGSIIQLLAVNIDPAVQNLAYGDQLLEFMLQRCSLVAGINQVVGVTLCKNYTTNQSLSFEQYIQLKGDNQDPVLAFHQSHGALVVKAMPGYRSQDLANQGYGVLVSYDILHRVRRTKSVVDTQAKDFNRNKIKGFVSDKVIELLGIKKNEFDINRPLMEMGLDSADLLKLQLQLEEKLLQKLAAGFFFEYNTSHKVIEYLITKYSSDLVTDNPKHSVGIDEKSVNKNYSDKIDETDIAIIGLSCKLPGGVESPDQLWQVLTSSSSVISQYSAGRGKWPSSDDMPAIDQAGFIHNVDAFDADFFRITPAEATVMDPQQRILLELAWACLENAGVVPMSLQGTATGVFIGASNCDYSRLIQEAGLEVQAHQGVGSSLAILANRLSYFFDFSGPSLLIDTACSSSLVALHAAIQSLRTGESVTALVGGVNLICHPDLSIAYHKAGMLAPDGKCKSFDIKANGYVRAEGAVMLLLKPLSKAIEDQDNVYGVIKGSAVNHGGLAGGLTVPNPQKQSELLKAAWKNAGITAHDLSYFEAHGTGTSLGDPIEIQGIQAAYGQENLATTDKKCAIGSIKTNLGHLEPAAGLAGVLKIILCMQYRQIPASLNFSELNPKIQLEDSPLYIQNSLSEWKVEQSRVAAVSSFGSGGANAHVVVQEYSRNEEYDLENKCLQNNYLFVLSANNEDQLKTYVSSTIEWLENSATKDNFADAIYTWQLGRTAMKYRLALKVDDHLHLQNSLKHWLVSTDEQVDTWYGQVDADSLGSSLVWQAKSGQQLISHALIENDLEQLGLLWTSGIDLDWNKLYEFIGDGKYKPKRIPLPSYPFAKDRYWIEMPISKHTVAKEPVATILHPLLHVNISDLHRQIYCSTFNGEEYFLADHQINLNNDIVQRVMPAVAYLEMARVAIDQAIPRKPEATVLELTDTVWTQPLVIARDKQVSIEISTDENEKIEFEIISQDESQHDIVHCNGRADFSNNPVISKLDIQQLRQQMHGASQSADEIYTAFTDMGLIYGPAHTVIKDVYQGNQQLLARLKLPFMQSSTHGDYLLHPSIMDGALQAAILLITELNQCTSEPAMPYALDSLRIISACTKDMLAWVRFSSDSKPDDIVVKFDIDLCDEQGNICVQMRGFSSRALNEGGSEKVSKSDLQCLVPTWNPFHRHANSKFVFSNSASILLLSSDQEHVDWLQKSFTNVHLLSVPSPATVEIMQEAMKDQFFDHLVWMAPDITHNSDDDSIYSQEKGVLAVFRIIKALLQLGYADKELAWTIITSKTQRVQNDEQIQATHAGIFGLIGSLAKEYPHWNLNLLDLDSLDYVTAYDCLSQTPDKHGNGLANRHGEWFHQEFALVPYMSQSLPIYYRQNGVYVVIGGAGGLGELWSRYMIENYQARMVWVGRDELNSAVKNKIDALSRLGPAPIYINGDATNLVALQHVFNTILEVYPVIHGVVHSAIILQDKSLQHMEESSFRAGLSAKIDISVNMDKVFGEQPLDFMLFFSSILSFMKLPGQSNYAAGCTFKDSFAHNLQQQRTYPVKIINWGYWGKVGIVADETYTKLMQRVGIGSIEPEEGMNSLQSFISSGMNQVALLKSIHNHVVEGIRITEQLVYYPYTATNETPPLPEVLATELFIPQPTIKEGGLQTPLMDELSARILASSLASIGLLSEGIAKITDLPVHQRPTQFYERWLDNTIHYLQNQKILEPNKAFNYTESDHAKLWAEWESKKSYWLDNSNLHAQTLLLETCLKALPEILKNKYSATDIIFPNSSMHLVEGIYRDNALADYYNDILCETLKACIKQLLTVDKERKIRILEIGAGTGGTTAKLLPVLKVLPIAEYCYTDVSKAFLMYAEENYQPNFPELTTNIFDVSKPLASQSLASNHYDVVIATNVLHATPNIRETLRNAKAAMKNQGILLINEISNWSLFTHLTFGLLEGWWLHEDTSLRLPGSPGLTPDNWQSVLLDEGFNSSFFPAQKSHQFGQQIIVASSDGWVRQRLDKQQQSDVERKVSSIKKLEPVKSTVPDKLTHSKESLREKAISYFQKLVASTLRMEPYQIEPQLPLAEYGLDSILVGQLNYKLRKVFTDVSSTLFFEVQSISGLSDYFLENRKTELYATLSEPTMNTVSQQKIEAPSPKFIDKKRIISSQTVNQNQQDFVPKQGTTENSSVIDVAVIGLSGRYPQSKDLNEFWANLSNGKNCITEIPKDRWEWEEYFDAEKGKPGKIYTKWGGFLDGIDEFDPLFFKISPKDAKRMDPQERLFLQSCYHALEDAGYTPDTLGVAEKIGVFVGVMNARYTPQPAHYSIANRVSYVFNYQGPSMAVDTACSSSLTAVHLALESIYSGQSSCAIAGGVNLIIDQVHYMELSELTMLSRGNQCKSFGEMADGFVDAEGVGVVVLKPLRDAQEDGDNIYGVIKGSSVNAGGKTNGYTVPNLKAQATLVSQAMQRAKVTPEQVSYIEAHGTGTALGDPIEIAGLTHAFKTMNGKKKFCSIGSLKSNIGHCESAAGIAGLTKVLLQLKHRQLVPSIHSDVINPEIDFSKTPFKVQKKLEEWHRPMQKIDGVLKEISRIAGVSSFGAGGSNAHVVVEEYLPQKNIQQSVTDHALGASAIILLSARTLEQLQQKVRDLLDFIRATEPVDLAAMAYTLQVGREAMDERFGLMVSTVKQLEEKLHAYINGEQDIDNTYQGHVKRNKQTLSLFDTDSDLRNAVDNWISNNKFSKLLDLWAKGMDLDWNKFYGEIKPQRISLPNYPFAKDLCWMNRMADMQVSEIKMANSILHPLLHTNTSDFSQQRYLSVFTGQEFFLIKRQTGIDGRVSEKVLPSVIYLEIARAAIEHAQSVWPESAKLELQDIVWAQPVAINHAYSINVALRENGSDYVDFEIYSENDNAEIVHCQGRATFNQQPAPATIDIEQFKARMGRGKIDADSVYAIFSEMGLDYGPQHQVITTIHKGEGELLAELHLPKLISTSLNDFCLHPNLIEGAMHAALGMVEDWRSPLSSPRLPIGVESVRIIWPCDKEMIVWVRYAPESRSSDVQIRLDIDLCDKKGKVCVQMRGINYPTSKLMSTEPLQRLPVTTSEMLSSTVMLPAPHQSVEVINQLPVTFRSTNEKPSGISLTTPTKLIEEQPKKRSITLSNEKLESSIESLEMQQQHQSVFSNVTLSDHGKGIFLMRINSPNDDNVISSDLIKQLLQAFSKVQESNETKVIIIEGSEYCFMQGGRVQFNNAVEQKLYQTIVSCPYPVIAAMRGDASGAGFLIGALCDFMLCSEESVYCYTQIQEKFYPTACDVDLFTERFGEVFAQYFLTISTPLTGRQLKEKSWTCPILPRAEIESYTWKLAKSLATKPQKSLSLLKLHLSRHILGLVNRFKLNTDNTVTQKNISNASDLPSKVTASSNCFQLGIHSEDVFTIRICNEGYQLNDLLNDLSEIILKINATSYYKAIVLVSDYPEFLPNTRETITDEMVSTFYGLIHELRIPIIGAIDLNARDFAWFICQFLDACIYSKEGTYSYAIDIGSETQAKKAAVIFSHRFGSYFGKEIIFSGSEYSGTDLQQGTGSMIVTDQDQVLAEALKLAESWAKMPCISKFSWKRHMVSILEEKIQSLPDWPSELINKSDALLPTVTTPVALDSKIISATVHPEGIFEVRMEERQAKNMFSDDFIEGIREVFEHIEQTPAYKVVILMGYDSYFASGGTQENLLAIQEGKAKFTDAKIFQLAMECKLPVIAAMQGHGIGGGWSLGMFADFIIMSEESRYVSPYMEYGFTPGAGSTLIFPRQIGYDLTKESLLTAQPYTGNDLKTRGILLPVLPRSDVYTAAMSLARKISQATRKRLLGIKHQLTRHLHTELEQTYLLELAMHEKTFVGQPEALDQIQSNFLKIGDNIEINADTISNLQPTTDELPAILLSLKKMLAQELHMQECDIDDNTQFIDLGMDSIVAVTWVRKINEKYKISMLATKVYSYPTLTLLSSHVKRESEKQNSVISVNATVMSELPTELQKATPQPHISASNLQSKEPGLTSAIHDADALFTIMANLKKMLAQELHMKEGDIDENTKFIDLGMDSIVAVTWVRKINEKYKISMLATKIYSYPTLTQLSLHVKETAEKQGTLPNIDGSVRADNLITTQKSMPVPHSNPSRFALRKLTSWRNQSSSRNTLNSSLNNPTQPIAVIGMAGQFPQARNLKEFWQNIAQGMNCISRVPAERWDIDAHYQQGDVVAGKTNCQWMGALEEYDLFDPLFFNISPTEAENMDPQQRLFLQACWHCIEDAGYNTNTLSNSNCGVFAGCAASDYQMLSTEQRFTAQGFTGGANSILAARISYFLNLQGPCISIDTACSSSLVALAQACDSLVFGNSDLALAGGVAVMAGHEMHVKTAQAGMLSPDGCCFTFDQRANGFVPGEAVGVVMLKRLADAEKDRDTIHGVIHGWGINQDGKTNGITAPNPESQTRLQQSIYDKFQIDPESIQFVEAHGTGTKLGDPIEVEGLKGSFAKYTQKTGYCALGSVKSNIGHCLAAAGIAGFIKVILALKHKQLPPTINFNSLNEHIELENSPFYINDQLRSWQANDLDSRRAAISSFGFSGTNAHLVVGEYQASCDYEQADTIFTPETGFIVPLSARTLDQLKQKARDLLELIKADDQAIDLLELAYTLQAGRDAMEERLGFMVDSVKQLVEKLEKYLEGQQEIEGVRWGKVKHNEESLRFFSQDKDLREIILNRLITHMNLNKLLNLWVMGIELDWNKFYGNVKPRRISLPLYPIAKERYWVDVTAVQTNPNGMVTTVLHPLLHFNSSDFNRQSYEAIFSGEEFFLRDHQIQIDGQAIQKVFPGVAYLEMARAAIEHASPAQLDSSVLELRDIVWIKPIIVKQPKQISIALSLNQTGEFKEGRIAFEIYSRDHEHEAIHFHGAAVFNQLLEPVQLDLKHLNDQMTLGKFESIKLYSVFKELGLHYGPAHQGIVAISLGNNQLLAQLRLPEVVEKGHHEYLLHPSIMDSTLQASVGLIVDFDHLPEGPIVPFAMESLCIFSACSTEMFAWIRYSKDSRPGDKIVKLDIDLCDQHGNICVQIQKFSARVMEKVDTTFDSNFYQKLINNVMNGVVSAGEAAEIG